MSKSLLLLPPDFPPSFRSSTAFLMPKLIELARPGRLDTCPIERILVDKMEMKDRVFDWLRHQSTKVPKYNTLTSNFVNLKV